MSNKANKKQHYIPQFYLKLFSIDKKSIATYLFGRKKLVFKSSIKNTAQLPYLYSEDENDLNLEHSLGIFEKRFCKVYKTIIENKDLQFVTDLEYLDLLQSIVVQLERTEYIANDMNRMMRETVKALANQKENSFFSDISKAKFLELTDQASLAVPNLEPLKMADKEFPFLFDLDAALYIIKDNCDLQFITSDTPVIMYNYLARFKGYKRNASRISHKGIILLLPLSSKICLLLYDPTFYKISKKIFLSNAKDIKHLNQLIIHNSYKQIFFSPSINKKQMSSLIKYSKKIKQEHKQLTFYENLETTIHFVSFFINEVIPLPKLQLTLQGQNFPKIPDYCNWPHRMENEYIRKFIQKMDYD